jgi:hypothetical protein
MVGSDHDLDYPPYLHRPQPPPPDRPTRPPPAVMIGARKMSLISIWTLALIAAAVIVMVMLVAT